MIPSPPKLPFQKVQIRSVMQLGNHMDDDNAMARHKPLLDWLKTRGYIADDRRSVLRWEGFPEQIVKRNGRYSIILTLTDASCQSQNIPSKPSSEQQETSHMSATTSGKTTSTKYLEG